MRESGGVHGLGKADCVDLRTQRLWWGWIAGERCAVWGEVVLRVLGGGGLCLAWCGGRVPGGRRGQVDVGPGERRGRLRGVSLGSRGISLGVERLRCRLKALKLQLLRLSCGVLCSVWHLLALCGHCGLGLLG